MKTNLFLASLFLFLISCTTNTSNRDPESKHIQNTRIDLDEQSHPPLIVGEVIMDDTVFGKMIELTGISHPIEPYFKVQETQMLAKENMFIIKNRNSLAIKKKIGYDYFMAYSLPDFTFIKSFGRKGKGPGEFSGPNIIHSSQPEYLFSIYSTGGRIYHVNRLFEVIDSKISLDTKRELFDPYKICAASSEEFYYVGVAPVAKEIYRYATQDSVPETSIKKLSIKGFKGSASYSGYLGANFEKDRLVFAYKYFKKIVFTDLAGNVERTITFNTDTKTEKQSNVATLGPSSVTYYWGLSAQKDFVYLLYSGRTPIEVMEEKENSTYYIYVEQFDWNGNPIRKFKLDRWGYFCVDDKEENIYLASTDDEHPLYSYSIPQE